MSGIKQNLNLKNSIQAHIEANFKGNGLLFLR